MKALDSSMAKSRSASMVLLVKVTYTSTFIARVTIITFGMFAAILGYTCICRKSCGIHRPTLPSKSPPNDSTSSQVFQKPDDLTRTFRVLGSQLNMRLLNINTLQLAKFFEGKMAPYVILSHRWGEGEVSCKDFSRNRIKE
jgi:hypothetical protein